MGVLTLFASPGRRAVVVAASSAEDFRGCLCVCRTEAGTGTAYIVVVGRALQIAVDLTIPKKHC